MLCEYGCGNEAKYQFKNGKWCCSVNHSLCDFIKNKISIKSKDQWNNINSKFHSKEYRNNLSRKNKEKWNDLNSVYNSKEWKEKQSKSHIGYSHSEDWKINHGNKLRGRKRPDLLGKIPWNKGKYMNIDEHFIKYPLFSKIEEMIYNPEKSGENEIQVHCKNHNCPNSKDKGGWFTPSRIQLYERIRSVEKLNKDLNYFYCCEDCKKTCPLFNLHNDPYKESKIKNYTQEEYNQFREYVLKRDDYKCQYCENKAEYVHHTRPQKLELFYSLDPDLAISVCKKCHYKYGHQDECSTGNLANEVCF